MKILDADKIEIRIEKQKKIKILHGVFIVESKSLKRPKLY